MKQKLLYILMMITALLGGNGEACAQTTSYVLEHPNQIEIYSALLHKDYTSGPIPLSGPGSTLTFEACKSNSSVGGLYIETSNDGSSWEESSSPIDVKANTINWKLQEIYNWTTYSYTIPNVNVRYIRFKAKAGATLTKYCRNIKVTRATTLSTSTSLIDFGNVTKGTASDEKYAVVHFENTNYNQDITGECSDKSFEITTTSVGATSYTGTWTGSDYKSTNPVYIPVTFKPTRLGSHEDVVVELTMAGVTTKFKVKGTGTTTYYGKAVATNSEGGNAYVTFDSNTASSTTTSQATTNKVSSNNSTSSTAYYRAVPHDGYEFVGWTLGESGEYLPNASFSTEISYSSEDSNAPSETIYKAWFRPIYYFSATAVCIYNHGNVEATVEDTQKSEGPFVTNAIFTAQPKEGCTFEGWYTDINHTQCVSKELTCTETITNTEPCSTANLTLYAWFKCNQTLSWNWKKDIQSLIQGTTVDFSATSDKGLKVFYKSSNPEVASVDENGIVTGNAPSNNKVTITAYQEGNDEYNAAPSLTRSFYVQQKWQPVFEVSGFTGNAPTLKVGETATITLSNVDGDFTFSSSDNTVVSISRNGNVLTLTALKAGNSKVTLAQPANATHNASTAEYNITVERYQGGLTVALPETMKVGETVKDFWNTSNSEVPVAVESSNPNVLSYTDGTLSAVGEGTAVITVKQAETDKWAGESRQQTITVSKVANTLGISLTSQETKVGSGIAVSLLNQNNTETPVIATITEQELSSEVNDGTDVISYADGIITAKNAGTAKITFSQSASAKYTAFTSSTYEITVTKTPNPITVSLNGGNALSIMLKYGATATLTYSSVHSDTQFEVSRTSGSYTTLSGNTITAGNAAGTDIYEVKQPETHKYEEGYAMFSIRVNNTNEEVGYVLYDETVYSRDVGGVIHTYELSGPGEILYYSADRVTGAIYYNLYAEYSIDGSSWTLAHDNTNIGTSYKDFSCAIPETARYVRFQLPFGGTLNKHIKNVKVPRKTYVRASADKTDLGTIYTGSTSQTTFTVDYSTTNGGNIHVNSSNPNFVVSSEELAVSAHSDGTKTFKVTYTPNPNQLGEESALITISDLFYTQEITLKAVAAKQDNTLNVVGEQNLKVGDIVDNVYSGKNSDAELTVSISSEGVVNFDAASNRLTAIGEGSAVVTLFQNANDNYHGITKTISVNVSKIANTLGIAIEKDNLKVGEKIPVNFTNKNSDGAITASYSVDGIVEYHNGEIVALKAGTTRITLTQAATVSHTSVSQSFDMTVTKHDQTVQWDKDLSDNDLELNVGQTLETNTATASSGLSVTYSSSNPAALCVDPTTGQLTAISSGVNIIITATQAGNDMYNAASITRSFNVISKMEATVITSLSASGTNELRIGGASVTIGCVTNIAEENFTITGEDGIVATAFENNTLTITPMKIGEVTITLTKAEDDSYYAINNTYHIQVLGASAILAPNKAPVLEYSEYAEITLSRTLSEGHSTLTLPFDTEIRTISNDSEAYAAQLALVTYNKADGYTLYFQKVTDGQMVANQPYVVYLPNKIENPTWKNVTVVTPNAESIEVSNWTMQGNYTPGLSMSGKYGIAGGEFCLGTEKSSINAYTAYFTFHGRKNVRTRVAVMDEGGSTTYIGELSDLNGNAAEEVFGIDGMRLPEMRKGINIVRQKDGSVRKIVK